MVDWIALVAAVALAGWTLSRAGGKLVSRRAIRVPAAIVVALLLVGWGAFRLSRARSFQVAGQLVARVDTDRKLVALTLDDGPTPEHTGEVLRLLARADARATFFVTGDALERHPELGRAIVSAGHELGNHSRTHRRMIGLGFAEIADEIESTDALIRSAGWSGDVLFRPPHGKKLLELPLYLARHDRVTILWDIEPDSDPRIGSDARLIADDVVARVRPGSIILLHVMVGSRAASRAALPLIAAALRERGYRFATVSELLASRAAHAR